MLDKINIQDIVNISKEAGKEILQIYATDFEVEQKEDNSPLTLADKNANDLILDQLQKKYPEIPFISEETKKTSYEERKKWEYLWLIDPLDGTKEFLKKNGEFTVNIALIHNQNPVLGVVHVPAQNITYWAKKGIGAYYQNENDTPHEIKAKTFSLNEHDLTLVCSRSHMSEEVENYLRKFQNPNTISMGSSLKFMLVADGRAHIYPRLAPTMEWDTAAAHAVLNEAGGAVIQHDNDKPLVYNKENLKNPHFIAFGNVNN
ncbi:MAG: 3'(2'),5'-bisphosphate nucleotidase CysQ [Bacteroidia bacterium]|nr:3'(2'),5'-bisphosphate nucleotidase CysQ [Bacteroidia bacterium]